jgi:hypothetical protein
MNQLYQTPDLLGLSMQPQFNAPTLYNFAMAPPSNIVADDSIANLLNLNTGYQYSDMGLNLQNLEPATGTGLSLQNLQPATNFQGAQYMINLMDVNPGMQVYNLQDLAYL